MSVRVQSDPFDAGAELTAFSGTVPGAGAVVSFTGIVRGDNDLAALEIEHYPAMTQSAIEAMVAEARSRWSLSGCLVIHRHGTLAVGEAIMMVATAAPHRRAAFEAADFLMDYLKSRAPFWKKEIGPEGAAWVAAKDSDEDDLNRW
ncbi:MAG: molybdenum cofactor biosynthesis protein MoaE [Rhodobacteraceae bacterium]|nr:molybdenum cofactor biosynthesis protein MoaE [Paracoccaceae bacterium]